MTAIGFLLIAAAASIVRSAATSSASFNRRLFGTFAINVLGAFALGLLSNSSSSTLLVVGVGGIGALTTFSTFILQIECIDREGQRRDAAAYVVGTLVGGIGAAWVGMELAL